MTGLQTIGRLHRCMANKDEADKPPKSNTISERSGVQLSLVIPLVSIAVVIAAGWENLSTKLDGVIAAQKEFKVLYTADGAALHAKVEKLEQEVTTIKAAGSPKVVKMQEQLDALERKVEVHIESTKGIKP